MSERTQINLVVDADRKSHWEEYANEQERSLSALIRLAVEKEVRSDARSANDNPSDEQLTELQSAVENIGTKVDGLHSRIADLEQQVTRESPEVRELASEVFDVLPTEEEVIRATHEPVIDPGDADDENLPQTGQPAHLAAYLGVEELRVHEALQKLQDDTAQVESRTIDGDVRYFTEG